MVLCVSPDRVALTIPPERALGGQAFGLVSCRTVPLDSWSQCLYREWRGVSSVGAPCTLARQSEYRYAQSNHSGPTMEFHCVGTGEVVGCPHLVHPTAQCLQRHNYTNPIPRTGRLTPKKRGDQTVRPSNYRHTDSSGCAR